MSLTASSEFYVQNFRAVKGAITFDKISIWSISEAANIIEFADVLTVLMGVFEDPDRPF
jgi:hypothetical protein